MRDLTPSEDAPAHVDVDALGRALHARLLATGAFAAPSDAESGERPVTRVEVQIGVEGAEVADKGVARAHVLARFDTRPRGAPGAIDERVEGTGEQPYTVPRADKGARAAAPKEPLYEGLVQRVAGDLFAGLFERRRVRAGDPGALRGALAADGGELRVEAIRAVGERHLTAEAPRLLALLEDPDEPTRDAALGALIALRDRRAVTVLTRSRSLRDRRELSKIIEAISILGGDEADDYLSFVAGSHDDEEIRAEATAARARLQRRADAAANPR